MAPVELATESYSELDTNDNRIRCSAAASKKDRSVENALISKIMQLDETSCDVGDEDSFFVADFKELKKSVELWNSELPQVHAHYAVKCNNDIETVRYLASQGLNFDCASKNEIEFVLGLGVSPDRIVYANPCKNASHIRYACQQGVNMTTVDNSYELYKLKKYHPRCGILIRLATDDSSAQCQLSTKFGCTVETALNELLPLANDLELNVRGVAFHIGSGAKDVDPMFVAIRDSRMFFDKAIELGFNVDTLDIGGGFERETFEDISAMTRYGLDKFFPPGFTQKHNIRFIAEPGRFMVASAFTLATYVTSKRDLGCNEDNIDAMLYINDGVYGNLNCILFDHQHPIPRLVEFGGDDNADAKGEHYHYSVWGPTCDGLDCVSPMARFPRSIHVGDWLYFTEVGAYTSAAATSFNGFIYDSEVIYINTEL
ncbi:Ornithine decarboxylase [Yamadazyma tenuis]|uniref:Ornithine decarboxylase n=1 Tax=Candida tenuis (strain ATCC 10573 / BCRC 21748 / CBS 615 / JCM 9827 / NBRC 10315 / NRRL Y-1498 / VKM Y-70) TaxID=590646 RepID=G3AY47_CANTC|nr:uncharacterized protein CANTEDRAFT_133180 [Yamadazyma tenuis ATCC 10573]XP_006684343.1 ornithine decarboxylase [Yamadazyma tenuis ATCC 10573]EGV65768.1 hypothetical protein CANTEDRAFT_133180 [Yamadazyma tenuis ATCC 10573]EGV65769.1 ornithine decarboxylase [Yamadazyma tenuis ATCC 10573]WEJ95912.1 Ornithine decarboxylase [Yamadazyma tenuis]